jgi:hypothetical protein
MLVGKQLVISGLVALAGAQLPPTPEGITFLKSKFHENVTISYKEVSAAQHNIQLGWEGNFFGGRLTTLIVAGHM